MKSNHIFVGVNGATLALTSGDKGVAVYPPQKGDKQFFVLMESGKVAEISGARIGGISVSRYLTEKGFALAQPGDALAAKLADMLDMRQGIKLVEHASRAKAEELQRLFAGQKCTFVPFEEDRACVSVGISQPNGCVTTSIDRVTGFASGAVHIDYEPDSRLPFDLALDSGWLVGPNGDAAQMPRNTPYGGIVERAVYVMCNCGLATLVGAQNLAMDDTADVSEPYPRGKLELALPNEDRIVVGINGGDDLVVEYRRAGALVYSRTGLPKVRLGEAIGAIAAVLIRVQELDAAATVKGRKKAA